MKLKTRPLVIGAYLTVCVVWGSTYLAIRVGVGDLPPFLFAGVRHLLAGLLLAAFCAATGQAFPRERRVLFDHALVGLLLLAVANGLVVWAEQWVNSSVAALLVATVPLFAAWLGALTGGRRVGPLGWLGLLIGLLGVALLAGPAAPQGGRWLAGAAVLLLASFSWALGSVYAQRRRANGAILPGISLQMLAAGIALIAAGLALGQAAGVRPTACGLAALAYLVLIGSLLGYCAYVYLLRNMPAARAATYAYVNPAVAVVLGYLVLGEPITARMLAALPLILGGVLLAQLGGSAGKGKGDAAGAAPSAAGRAG